MDRRIMLLGLTGAAAASLSARSTVAHAQGASTTDILDSSSYAADTLQIGTLSKTISQLALQKSKNVFVLRFAKLEIDEQTAVAESLTSNFDPPPAQLTDAQQQVVVSLQALTGEAFNAAYIQAQIQGHHQLAVIQSDFLAGDTNPADDFVHVALIATAFIQTHLSVLYGLVPLKAI